ncbi:LPXTG cell wall anchor domain-containing protein [Enterococcus sp. HY326]|uniref:LPXTG cell wall anchor domain-containing protein n=1 Tax=Enterococcus sp. HY326 TaxID=2971265 RepID=UPI002240C7CB|nr:bacterial Ig-like domain-containing protein [Enterococcus sp. HY326]
MKSKKMIGLTLVTLLAPTFLNAHVAFADSAEVAQPEEVTTAPVPDTTAATAAAETPQATPEVEPTPDTTAPSTEETVPPVVEETTPSVGDEAEQTTPSVETPAENNNAADASAEVAVPTETEETPAPAPALPIPPVTGEDADSPMIKVAPQKTVKYNSTFNPLEGVFATDADGTDLTSQIKVVTNTVNTSVPTGVDDAPYQVVYSVTNAAGKTTTATVEVLVAPENVGFLSVSPFSVTVAQGGDYQQEITEKIVVLDSNGNVAPSSDYVLSFVGGIYAGEPGSYQITVLVYSTKYNTLTEAVVTINVIKGLNLTASDQTLYVGQTFEPMDNVTATEVKKDGSTVALGAYDGSSDTGISYTGTVDTTTAGVYPVTYTAKNSAGVIESKTVNITVEKRVPTIVVADQTVYQDQVIDDATIWSWATISDPVDSAEGLTKSYTITPISVMRAGSIDTTTVGSAYTVEYTVTNTAGEVATKSITVTVAERLATINATDQVVGVGDIVDDETILGWATASDVVDGDNLPVTEYTVVGGETIDTSIPGSTYTVIYSYTNSAGNVATKAITVTVAELQAPTITVADRVMYIGDTITEEMVLGWAETTNAEYISFEIIGDGIPYDPATNTLVEAGEYQIKFTAYSGMGTAYEQTAETTMTLTVKEKENATVTTPVDNKTNTTTKTVTSGEKPLPATGEKESSMMATVLGLTLLASVYFMKKKREDEFNLF